MFFTLPRPAGDAPARRPDKMADPLASDDAFIPFSYGMPEMANSPGHALKRIPKHTPTPAAQPLALDEFVPFGEPEPDQEADDEPQAAATAESAGTAAPELCWSPGSVYGGDSVLLALHEDVDGLGWLLFVSRFLVKGLRCLHALGRAVLFC